MGLLKKIFRSENSRNVAKLDKIAKKIEEKENEYKAKTDEELKAMTGILKERLAIPKEQIIAIGDNENDVEMFKEAGISVAMENAKDPVKQQADFVAADNDHDGAAEFLEKFLKL